MGAWCCINPLDTGDFDGELYTYLSVTITSRSNASEFLENIVELNPRYTNPRYTNPRYTMDGVFMNGVFMDGVFISRFKYVIYVALVTKYYIKSKTLQSMFPHTHTHTAPHTHTHTHIYI